MRNNLWEGNQMIELRDKVAIITGGAMGIGLATAKALAEKGVKTVIADHNQKAGMKAQQDVARLQADATYIQVDVSNERSVERMISETVAQFGKIDILINNAGISSPGITHRRPFEEYRKVISVNQDGVYLCAKHAIREMLKTGGGSIVNISSVLGLVGKAGSAAYNAAKGAVTILTKSLALEYAKQGIRVNAVCPGYIDTGFPMPFTQEELASVQPIGRLGRPEEVAHAILFLCENEFITGSSLMVDGGYTAQ